MTWQIEKPRSIEAFEEAVRDYLMRDEAVHNIQLGLLETLRERGQQYSGDNFLGYVHSDGRLGGVAMRTPPYPALISKVEDDKAAANLAAVLVEAFPELDGLNAPQGAASGALGYLESVGFDWEVGMRQRLYRAASVEAPGEVAGKFRRADDWDRERVADWFVRFQAEVAGETEEEAREKVSGRADALLRKGEVFLWEADGEVVSMAAYAGHAPSGVRIGYVYTPPEYREQGFGSAVTAGATEHALDGDSEHCFLYTDLGNETTNRIYPEIGYEPVTDQIVYRLRAPNR